MIKTLKSALIAFLIITFIFIKMFSISWWENALSPVSAAEICMIYLMALACGLVIAIYTGCFFASSFCIQTEPQEYLEYIVKRYSVISAAVYLLVLIELCWFAFSLSLVAKILAFVLLAAFIAGCIISYRYFKKHIDDSVERTLNCTGLIAMVICLFALAIGIIGGFKFNEISVVFWGGAIISNLVVFKELFFESTKNRKISKTTMLIISCAITLLPLLSQFKLFGELIIILFAAIIGVYGHIIWKLKHNNTGN